jgi:CPA1 family monovalent cation:H+ antiporter
VQLFVILIGITAAVGFAIKRFGHQAMPYSVALVLSGLLIGVLFPGINPIVTPQLVLLILLPGLVFEASYRIQFEELRRSFGGIALLAAPGVLIAAAIVAILMNLGTGMPIELGFVVGAMVAATDPAAVVSTFQRLPTPRRLDTLVQGESLLNDGTGLVAFAIAIQAVTGHITVADALVSFVATIVISSAIGIGVGWIASRAIAMIDDHLLEVTISIVTAYGTYLLADALHDSGVIATVAAGVVMGNYGRRIGMTPRTEEAIDTVWEFIGFVLTAVVFLLVGLAIPISGLLDSLPWIAWGVVGILVGRAVVIYGMLGVGSRLPRVHRTITVLPTSWLHVLFWAGLRGAVAVAVALSLPADFPQRTLLQEITFGIVLFTLALQGTTIDWVVRRSGALNESVGGDEQLPVRQADTPQAVAAALGLQGPGVHGHDS